MQSDFATLIFWKFKWLVPNSLPHRLSVGTACGSFHSWLSLSSFSKILCLSLAWQCNPLTPLLHFSSATDWQRSVVLICFYSLLIFLRFHLPALFLSRARMRSRVMCSVASVYMYVIFKYVCQQKTGRLLPFAQKSPTKCILLLSSWVKMPPVWFIISPWVKIPPVWFVMSNELYRQSTSYFSIRATWALWPQNIVLWYAKYVH